MGVGFCGRGGVGSRATCGVVVIIPEKTLCQDVKRSIVFGEDSSWS